MSEQSVENFPSPAAPPRLSLPLKIYNWLSWPLEPVWRTVLLVRVILGKERNNRALEKLGRPSAARPDGLLIWLHGVSIGECQALRPVIERLGEAHSDCHFLLTTSTAGSLKTLEEQGLPPRTIHQFAPLDSRLAVRRFLHHWKPDVFALSERDFWPGTIMWAQRWAAQNGKQTLLINSRMSNASFERREKYRSFYEPLLSGFPRILLQDQESLLNFTAFGIDPSKLEVVGNIKSASPPLPDQPELSSSLAAKIGQRSIWVAASTHAREAETIAQAHVTATKLGAQKLLTINAPRKPEAVALHRKAAENLGLKTRLRSEGLENIDQIDMLIIDSLGEMGVWFRAGQLVFMGFSLATPDDGVGTPPLTGKNPFEALALEKLVVHGPTVGNFQESYDALDHAGATRRVETVEDLAALIVSFDGAEQQLAAARRYMAEAQQPVRRTVAVIEAALKAAS
jgi:3-deoxy-D-manno-octulosonic-acid transferase